ncbi:hypothetical protein A8B98_16515 [Hymenobacter sp. UV11]|nr:hypothetical protein A8B98_16515 [Hymenobacter sp. UV11]
MPLILLLLGLLLGPYGGQAQTIPAGQGLVADSTELRALHAFYRSTQGDHWFNRTNWPATDSAWARATMAQVGTWAGLATANGDVIVIDFFNNGIGGTLPPELGLLTGLQYLHIERNHIYGPQFPALGGKLPKELGQLQHLTTLHIGFTALEGSIPPELGNMQALQHLQLENNHLDGVLPPELGNLTQLIELSLDNYYRVGQVLEGYGNLFSGNLPPEIGRLSNLTVLGIGMGPHTGFIPKEWGQLHNLQALYLDDASLSGAVPAEILRLPNLTGLALGGSSFGYSNPNSFTTLPDPALIPNIGTLGLNLQFNQFSFGTLEPYFDGPGHLRTALGSSYLPQSERVLPADTLVVTLGQAPRFDASQDQALGGTRTHYQWQRQVAGRWVDLPGQTQAVLTWGPVTAAQAGYYRCRATNDWVTDLTLYSHPHYLDVQPRGLPRNLPDDTNQGGALAALAPAPDAQAVAPADVNFVRTWVPRVALQPQAPPPPAPAATGVILREQWDGVAGSEVSGIPTYLPPTSTGYLSSLEGPTDDNQFNYGDRTRGYLVAPQSGDYVFAIAGDDNSEFWLSPDSLPAHQVRRAYVPGYTPSHGWHWYPDQQYSVPITLVAGQRYYLEVLHKQGYGGDNVAVGWLPPGTPAGAEPVVIPGSALAPLRTAPAADAPPGWSVDVAQRTTQYLDGLGRPIQTVRHGASPQYRDLVQPQAYDGLGREPRQYLPYAADTAPVAGNPVAGVGYHYQALSEQQDFYHRSLTGPPSPQDPATGVARTGVAYAETLFEASPLNRVLQQGAAGEAWQLAGGHVLGRRERPNSAADSVLRFTPGYDPRSLDPGYQGFYALGELWGTEGTDAQGPATGGGGYRTIEWKDKLGQLVLKQVEAARAGGAGSSRWLRTAYVYDDFGHLRFVLQPEATKQVMATIPGIGSPAPTAGLQLWLPLDEPGGTRATDYSGQGHPGTLTGAGAWLPTAGADGRGALSLRATQSLHVPLNWPAGTPAFTLSFWLRPTSRFNYSQGTGGGWGSFLFVTTSAGALYVGTDLATSIYFATPNTVELNVWQHFVFTFDHGVGTIYKNGQPLVSQAGMSLPQAWPELVLGFELGLAGDELYDEVRLYNRTLAGSEVQALYHSRAAYPPQAVQPFLFHYRYDGRGRQIAKQVPGQDGETLVVYDQLDRPVLSQDAQQRTRQEWSWTKYDALGRIILSGLVTRGDTLGQVSLQAIATADTATNHQYEQRTTNASRYPQFYTTDQSFPQLGQQGFGAGQVLSVTAYDDYNFDNDAQGVAEASYDTGSDFAFPAGQAPVPDALRTTGLVTQTRTRVLNRPASDPGVDWLVTTTFYDERARPVQVQTLNARGGHDRLTTQLDFTGKVVQSVAEHQGIDYQPLTVQEFFTYDHDGRVLTSRQQLPGEASPALLDSVQYNELGQVTRKTLATGRLRQDVDYAYNIRGWLTSLNDPYSPNPTKHDLFHLSLHYERGFTKGYEQYNGNLTGQTWRGRDGVQRAYGYVYDPLNRMLQGDFVARAGGSAGTLASATAWNQEQDNYRLAFVSYDDNGNINTLRRQGLLKNATHATGKQYGAVDNLTYAYQGNRLQAVDDAVSGNQLPRPANYNGASTSLAGDFQEQGVHQSQEYGYDANGNLTADKNKGITGILYNHLNLPRQIHFGAVGDSVVFRYSAAGQKVAKLVYQTGKSTPQRTDYLGPYQYEQDSLKFFPHAEGRVLRFVSYDAAHQPTVSYQREFTFKDHLGNLRLAYRAGQTRTYLASLEQDDNTRQRETQQFDSLSVSSPIAVATSWAMGQYAAKLNAGGASRQPLGPLIQLTVQKGDSLRVSAPGLYPQKVNNSSFAFSLASFVASLLQPAPAGTPPSTDGSRRGGLPLLQIGLNAATLTAVSQLSDGVPKGYLRVLVFNQDSVLVDQRKLQLSTNALGHYEVLHDTLSIRRDGYVTIYVGNESAADVFFDEVRIEHRQGLQVQENQYDPYGLDLAGVSGAAPGLRLKNYYQFNGKENQLDLGLNWNHHDARFFDYQLGRWHVVDPMVEEGQEHWTPYQFGFDNAVRYSDPDGQFPPLLVAAAAGAAIGAIIGGGIEAGTQMYQNGGHVSDWHAVGGAALQGGVTGGMAGLTAGTSLIRSGAVGAVSNVAGGIARNVYDGKPVTVGSVAKDAAVGAAIGVAGHAAGKLTSAVVNRVKGGAAAAEAEVGAGARAAKAPCGCFTAGTGVSTRAGRKPIEHIQVGDSVWAYNERTRSTALRPVTHLFRYERDTVYVLHTAAGEAIRTTSDHPFYVRGHWVRVRRLRVGDSLVSQNGQRHVLRRIELKPEHVTVYNFTVDELHTYFVGQNAILVHNSGPCDLAIKETQSVKGTHYSKLSLTESEALQAGETFVGKNARELTPSGSGAFRSVKPNADGTFNQFRIDKNSLLGTHKPSVPHVHLEIVREGVKKALTNNHVPITK